MSNINTIIETATKMFRQRGIKSVSMDDLSHELGISKRTLYENFSSKDELLCECLKYNSEKRQKDLNELCERCKDSIEIIVNVMYYFLNIMKNINPVFMEEIRHVQFQGAREFFEKDVKKRQEGLRELMLRGIEEGYICNDIDVNLVSKIIGSDSKENAMGNICQTEGVQRVFASVYLIFFRGMATQKGVERIDELIERYKKSNNNIYTL